jgi:Uma2 family endonuclease
MISSSDIPVAREVPVPPSAPVSFEEFLAWVDEDTHAEWVDGRIVLMSPSNADHQFIVGFLYRLLAHFLETRGLGLLLLAPFLMRLPSRPSGREPDLLFLSREHVDRFRDTYIDGPADLVVEIVSPDSGERDRGEKFAEYETAGVPEYWLLDPLRQDALFYVLGPDGRYRRGPLDADGFYHSTVLAGFRLKVTWLWQRPLPPVGTLVQEIEA